MDGYSDQEKAAAVKVAAEKAEGREEEPSVIEDSKVTKFSVVTGVYKGTQRSYKDS